MTRAVFVCGHAAFPHLFRLPFDVLPPDLCPVCNCPVYRVPASKAPHLVLQPKTRRASLTIGQRDSRPS